MSKLDEIVRVNIEIARPAVDSANFDNLLILGPPPQTPKPGFELPIVGVYSDLSEVTDAGYVAVGYMTDPVGVAARIAFSQIPKPDRIYIAAQRTRPPLISYAFLKLITVDNALTDAVPIGTIDPSDPIVAESLPWLQITYARENVTRMEIVIEKDGTIVWGNSLPTTENPNGFVQVLLGDGSPTEDQMNIPSANWPGTYTVTLTSARGFATTIITRQLQFDGVNWFVITAEDVDETTPVLFTPVETLDEAVNITGWYVVCSAGIDESVFEQIAEWAEAQTKLFGYTFLTQDDPVGGIFFRSHGWCGLERDRQLPADVPEANKYLHVGATAKCLNYPAGSETWALKQLAALYPAEISSTLRKKLTDGDSNFYSKYGGRNITMNGRVRGGEWIDIIRGRDWLQNDMQLRILNLLIMNPKIPYTNPGIALVENQMRASLKEATRRGIVAPDEWDEDGNLVEGFRVSVPNSQSLSATQKASRVLVDCRFWARIAGAIHAVRVDGTLTYEFWT